MIAGLDSAIPPSPAQADQARAAGVTLWSGYLATRSNVGLYRPWSLAEFDAARRCGATPIAYCSGRDDPGACKALAAKWNVRLCLDVENGIRPDGSWVQPWLTASGAGLYGNAPVHKGRTAPFHVLAGYYGYDPRATWGGGSVPPEGPKGWQWQGTHEEFGVGVDRGWFDDWFGAQEVDDLTPEEHEQLRRITVWAQEADDRAGQALALVQQINAKLDQHSPSSIPQDVQDAIKVVASHLK